MFPAGEVANKSNIPESTKYDPINLEKIKKKSISNRISPMRYDRHEPIKRNNDPSPNTYNSG